MTQYGDVDLGQLWLRQWLVAWWHQAITWTNVDLPSVMPCGIHLRAFSGENLKRPASKTSLKIVYWLHPDFTGASELKKSDCYWWFIKYMIMLWLMLGPWVKYCNFTGALHMNYSDKCDNIDKGTLSWNLIGSPISYLLCLECGEWTEVGFWMCQGKFLNRNLSYIFCYYWGCCGTARVLNMASNWTSLTSGLPP